MDETLVVHRFDGRGRHTGTLGAPGDDSGWKEEYGYPSPAELQKGKR